MDSDTLFIRANNYTQQIVKCNISDQLLSNIAVSVLFFYRESIDSNILIDSLRELLSDFPVFAGTLKDTNNNLYIDCNNKGLLFSVSQDNCVLGTVLNELPNIETKRLINTINPKKATRIIDRNFIM